MATHRSPAERKNATAQAVVLFAAVMLAVVGIVQIFQGIVGIAKDDVLVDVQDYTFALDTRAWGWIHVLLGVLFLALVFSLGSGRGWARAAGIVLAVVSIVTNFVWMPYYPVWAIVVIVFDVVLIWALATFVPSDGELPADF